MTKANKRQATPAPRPAIKRGGTTTVQHGSMRFTIPTLRDDKYGHRLSAFQVAANALKDLNRVERTQVIAALAEFFQLSLMVENNT